MDQRTSGSGQPVQRPESDQDCGGQIAEQMEEEEEIETRWGCVSEVVVGPGITIIFADVDLLHSRSTTLYSHRYNEMRRKAIAYKMDYFAYLAVVPWRFIDE